VRVGVTAVLTPAGCRSLLSAALEAAGAPAGAAVTLTLSDDDELAALNAEHMGKDGPTDVLSFPLLPPSAYPAHEGQDPAARESSNAPTAAAFALPPGQPIHLGDIVVSVERAIEQAKSGHGGHAGDLRWESADELRLLITHGALHLCGWDHAVPVEEGAMRALERRLLGLPEPST
jgi:probable rRNA maturation factor